MRRRFLAAVSLVILGLALKALVAADPAPRKETALAKLAAQMKPGEWAELKTEGLDRSVLNSPKPGTGMALMGWSDDAHWDSKTGQFLFMGLRQTRQMMVYREATNSWRAIALPEDHEKAGSPPKICPDGHTYSRNAHDPERGQFYHMDHNNGGGIYRFDLATEQWSKLPAKGSYSLTGVIEYFSVKKWLVYVGDNTDTRCHIFQVFDTETNRWSDLGKIPVHGYHSLGRHNPFRQEVLLAGGDRSPRAMLRLTKEGKVESLPDFPETDSPLTVNLDKITVDPRSGKYLILKWREKRFYEFDSATGNYQLIDDFAKMPWPFHRFDQPIVAFIAEHGVTMWAANSRVMLYKHRTDK